jgi:acetylglutamate kinase
VLDGETVLQVVSCGEIEQLVRQNKVSGGMILKLEACKRALSAGVKQVRIVGGTNERGLLSAANGEKGPGTRVLASYPARAGAAQ